MPPASFIYLPVPGQSPFPSITVALSNLQELPILWENNSIRWAAFSGDELLFHFFWMEAGLASFWVMGQMALSGVLLFTPALRPSPSATVGDRGHTALSA